MNAKRQISIDILDEFLSEIDSVRMGLIIVSRQLKADNVGAFEANACACLVDHAISYLIEYHNLCKEEIKRLDEACQGSRKAAEVKPC